MFEKETTKQMIKRISDEAQINSMLKMARIRGGMNAIDKKGSGKYCNKFNDSCREHNREKYNRQCFICGKDETDNGQRLSVHHVDMNKDQGCDDHKWKLVPLCKSCHHRMHNATWQARIEYLLTKYYLKDGVQV